MLASVLDRMFDLNRLTQSDELESILERHLAGSNADDIWDVRKSPPWTYVHSLLSEIPEQGWKIHLSATVNSAADVLAAVLPVLVRARTCFKFVMNLRLLRLMNSQHAPRAASGKFITVYPENIEAFRALVAEFNEATAGFKGPAILSDKPFRPGSLVHYRYGGFKPLTTYDANGVITYSLRGPGGTLVSDIRSVSSRMAEWVVDPFALPQSPTPRPQAPSSIILHGRYLVTQAIRHANKGGVYLATDQASGEKVVIKEARPHVATDRLDRDATDRLRGEAEVLEKLSGMGLAPRPIELFWEGGHLFLALEWLPGRTLREYVVDFKGKNLSRVPQRKFVSLSRRLARILESFHARGMVIRDFSPNNVMITPKGRLFLIDLEMACRAGDEHPLGIGEGTPGYASPQQIAEAPASFEDDYFSLGGILFFLATLRDPVFPGDEPNRRTLGERTCAYLKVFLAEQGLPNDLMTPIMSNLHPAPEERWPPGRMLRYLSTSGPSGRASVACSSSRRLLSEENARRNACKLASAVVDQITASLDFGSPTRPFLPTCLGESSHPCNIQHGTAGIGISLLMHARVTGKDCHVKTVHELSRWTIRYLDTHPDAPPGLYFGIAGTAWFLLEAATLLGDQELREAGMALALRLPTETPISDITHGAAGIGLTLLHFFHQTGDPHFLQRVLELAEALSSRFSAKSETGALTWTRSRLTTPTVNPEETFYGFAHGIAGIAYFYLCLFLTVRREEFLDVTRRSAETLLATATPRGRFLYWPHGPTRSTLWPHWCNGNSGVGTFLVRFAAVTGDGTACRLAVLGARAILRERWISALGQCHGLAGNGDYLIDLFQFTGEQQFLQAALYLAELIDLHRVYRPSGITFPDDTGLPTGIDFSIGPAGIASFLSRLASGSPRPLMLDYLFPGTTPKLSTSIKIWS